MVKFGKQNQPVDHCDIFGSAIVYHPCAPLFKQTSIWWNHGAARSGWGSSHVSVSLSSGWGCWGELLPVCLWSLRLAKLSLFLYTKDDRYDVQPEQFKIIVRHCEGHVHNYWDVWQMVFDANLAPTFPNLAGHCAAKILHLWLCQVLSCITTGAPCGSHQLWPCGKHLYSASWYSSPANCLASAWFRRAVLAEKNMQVLPLVFPTNN